jgi:hypothetical protein
VKFRLTKADGTSVKDTPTESEDKVAMVNLGLHSLFRQVEVSLNSITVSTMLDVLLLYGHDAKETMLQSEMYFKDLAGNMDSLPGGRNSGLEYRFILAMKGYEVK